jgi:hypothetical protein
MVATDSIHYADDSFDSVANLLLGRFPAQAKSNRTLDDVLGQTHGLQNMRGLARSACTSRPGSARNTFAVERELHKLPIQSRERNACRVG